MITIEDFQKLDIRVGTIKEASDFIGMNNKSYKLVIDFGSELGIKKTSARITEIYKPSDLIGKQVLAIVNLPKKQIKNFMSEVLVLGTYSKDGVILITPDKLASNGDKLG